MLKFIALIAGLTFTLLGYLILFKKKYSLIHKSGIACNAQKKTNDCTKLVGMVDFVVGIAMVIAAAALILFE